MRDSVKNFYYTSGKEYIEKGYATMQDVPNDLLDPSTKVGRIRLIQKKAHINNHPHIDPEKLVEFFSTLIYPIHFLDFEAYDRGRSKKIPFQHSLHILSENQEIEHFEFLGRSKNPQGIMKNHLQNIVRPKGSIVVFNKNFEKKVLRQIGLPNLVPRLADIWMPFRNFYYYHPKQRGSTSLKAVYPAVTGKNGYKELAVSNGMHAQERYKKMLRTRFDEQRVKELLEYCKLDTYSMVEIHNVLTQSTTKITAGASIKT